MRILIVGAGAREHALALAVARSPLCDALYVAPGNPGIESVAQYVSIQVTEVARLAEFSVEQNIDFVIVGPEAPLSLGLADLLTAREIAVFGPSQAAARLESSKAFTKELCRKHGIPTAEAEIFDEAGRAKIYVRARDLPIVIKADGLAAGKGVVIARSLAEADDAIDAALGGRFGAAGTRLVIEQFLHGEEISFFALVDGTRAIPFGSAQDHKAAFDGDQGPNTGGMGAYSPSPLLTEDLQARIMRDIIDPTVAAMAEAGAPFRGVLFAGLMIVADEPYLIEYNARFGDPECEVLMARLDSDIVPLLLAAARGELGGHVPVWRADSAMAVVLASCGYPGDYETGSVIGNLAEADAVPCVTVLHAGTARADDGRIVSAGGRVLAVTASAPTLEEARDRAYRAVDAIDWPGGFCRRDIGWRALRDATNVAELPQSRGE